MRLEYFQMLDRIVDVDHAIDELKVLEAHAKPGCYAPLAATKPSMREHRLYS